MNGFTQKLEQLKDKGRYRSLNLAAGMDLTSNDYLGLAGSDTLREAAIDFLQGGGDIGAGGSRLLRGHTDAHADLEEYAAAFFAAPSSLYFATGFQANIALFQALPSRHDTIIYDEFVHASSRDGIQNAHATKIKVPHNDFNGFEAALKKVKGQAWIAVESVYSMDGDVAPLDGLYHLAARYDAMLIVDEAHGVGVMGADGKGVSQELIAQHGYERLIVVHTCGKALGLAGGLMCASQEIVEYMINAARGFIYSTAPMPLQAHLVQKALAFLASEQGQQKREALSALSKHAQKLFGGAGTHIVPIMIGDDAQAVYVADMLQQKGWDIRAIRPPTVPEGTARLRLSLNADMSVETLAQFAADFEDTQKRKAA